LSVPPPPPPPPPPPEAPRAGWERINAVLGEVQEITTVGVGILMSIAAGLSLLFAIYIGFRLATAKDDGTRFQAKAQLIYSLMAAVSVGALAAIYSLVLGANQWEAFLYNITGRESGGGASPDPFPRGSPRELNEVFRFMREAALIVLNIFQVVSVLFALWVGWQLAKAEDEGSRKNAKLQLMYSIIGVVVVLLVVTIIEATLGYLHRGHIPEPPTEPTDPPPGTGE